MGFDAVEPEQRRLLRRALDDAGLTLPEVWLKYFSLGGEAGEYEMDAYLNGSLSFPPLQRDILALAVNELIDELPEQARAPYASELPTPGLSNGFREPGDGAGAREDGEGPGASRPGQHNAGED